MARVLGSLLCDLGPRSNNVLSCKFIFSLTWDVATSNFAGAKSHKFAGTGQYFV